MSELIDRSVIFEKSGQRWPTVQARALRLKDACPNNTFTYHQHLHMSYTWLILRGQPDKKDDTC